MAKDAKNPPVRDPANPAGPGDNLTAEEKREVTYRARLKSVTDTMEEKDRVASAMKAVNKRLSTARAAFKRDTLIELQDLDTMLRIRQLQRTERSASLQNINWMSELEGLAPGGQLSMFGAMKAAESSTPTLTKDALDWEMDGRVAGGKGVECKAPEGCPAINVPDWTKGWHFSQERLAWALAADKPIDRDPSKDRAVSPPPLDAEPDDDVPCEVCGGDGALLAEDLAICPSCGAEYEADNDAKTSDPLLN